jgi:hypothetical protein
MPRDRGSGEASFGRRRCVRGALRARPDVRDQVATIPEANRKLVSFHEAFPTSPGVRPRDRRLGGQVPGQDPSAGEVAALVDAIKRPEQGRIPEAGFNPTSQGDRDEAGVRSRATSTTTRSAIRRSTLRGSIRWDVERIVAALGGRG